MSLINILHTLLIKPLELVFEIIYSIANGIIGNPGLSIIALSLTMNILVLPLYMRADAMQAEEQEVEKKLSRWVSHIKKTFKGDERFMMLQTYYRLNDYKPTYALRGSLSLFLEIPFFIAAYRFLSHLDIIKGVSFGPIADLGAPDGIIAIGGLSINLLPILMTAINIVSGAIYTKGASLKTKLQLWSMALIFLIFLYKSPAGLVFYWTLNNLFSLIKNVFYKLKNPRLIISIISSLAGVLIGIFVLSRGIYSNRQKLILCFLGLILQLPLIIYIIKSKLPVKEISDKKKSKNSVLVFILSSFFIAILVGCLIPSTVISTSAAEFVDIVLFNNPLYYVGYSTLIACGLFVVWMAIFYYLTGKEWKWLFTEIVFATAVVFAVDYMFFGTKLGNLSPQLQFDNSPYFMHKEMLINMLVIIGILGLCHILYTKLPKLVVPILLSGIVVLSFMGIKNISSISSTYHEVVRTQERDNELPKLRLSRTEKNVVVIMMDRMISYYVPYIMNEKPELYSSWDGFTYYPNCATYGRKTNAATPSLYGGYEYIPTELNKRSDELLGDKQNEALKVMPVLFDENGYDVTVCDPTFAGYGWIPDTSIYNDYPDINAYVTMGRVNPDTSGTKAQIKITARNFICYSFMKVAPVVMQTSIYNNGNYYSTVNLEETGVAGQVMYGISRSSGLDSNFMNSYNVLKEMNNMTEVSDSSSGGFVMMSNDTTHSPCLLKEPEYVPSSNIDNTSFDDKNHIKYSADGSSIDIADEVNMPHYQVNMATMLKLGEWFDYLREEGVWDNTKIIIVSDHGYEIGLDKNRMIPGKLGGTEDHIFDLAELQSTLLVKNYGSKGFYVDNQFMTEADVPTLATKGNIENPVNPFTGKAIENSEKNNGVESIFVHNVDVNLNNGTTFLPEEWFSVHDNIFEYDNWKYLGYY